MLNSTIRYLTDAGWSPGRHIDTEPYVRALEAAGFEAFPVQIQFLAEFGGVVIERADCPVVRFDVIELLSAQDLGPRDDGLDSHDEYLGVNWSPIGLNHWNTIECRNITDDLVLMMTDSGTVYGVGQGFEMTAGHVGADDLMDKLCEGLWQRPPNAGPGWLYQPAPGYPRKADETE